MWRTAEILLRRTAWVACLTLSAVGMAACGSSGGAPGGGMDGGESDAVGKRDVSTAHDAGKDGSDSGHGGNRDSGHDARSTMGDGSVDGLAAGDSGSGDSAGGDATVCPDASVVDGATVINCTGKCGPVLDPCTGTMTLCGGCSPAMVDGGTQPRVCDLTTNTCGPVETTCAEVGAQCGVILTSCGAFVDCPDGPTKGCPAGQQCNYETSQCEACQPVTCLDIGYECGLAWLGCGPDTPSNYTDCGTCPANQVCNLGYNICEPNCTPMSAATLCAAAGAQCGYISNGCGGLVDCDTVTGLGCPTGQQCGLGGIANQCTLVPTPVECVALGQNCGTLTSVCTGDSISCGNCPTGQVCNSNGVCGPPCTPKTCMDFTALQCGTFDDSCGGKLMCGTCPGGICNEATNMCCTEYTCGANYAGECGTNLSDGCGTSTLACPCGNGETCVAMGGSGTPPNGTPGTCCTATMTAGTYAAAGQCGNHLPNGCGVDNVTANCSNGQECVGAGGAAPPNGTVGMCCTPPTCSGVPTGTCASIQDTCITSNKIACDECTAPKQCLNGDECCTPAPACPANACNITEMSPDCGAARACNCANGQACLCGGGPCGMGAQGTCTPILTCASGYAGMCGTDLSNGVGQDNLNCPCGNGHQCVVSGTTNPPPNGTPGVCVCDTPTGVAYTCANVPDGPMTGGPPCGTFNNGCGGSLVCGCSNGETCNTSVNPAVCCMPTTCPANPTVGTECGQISNGCGGDNNCGCAAHETCHAGACCAPTSCPANPTVGTPCGEESNGCGGNNDCGCGAGEVCNAGACCAPTSCPAYPGYPAGVVGMGNPPGPACGSISNQCGGSNDCTCPHGTNEENWMCVAGTCSCVPFTCQETGGVGPQPDGCGGQTVSCGG
jgi:hypothetical protein